MSQPVLDDLGEWVRVCQCLGLRTARFPRGPVTALVTEAVAPRQETRPPADNNCYTPPMARVRAPHRHPPTTPEVMTISDLAVYLQMSQSSLYKLVQRGSVPGHKIGRHWRFHKVSIDKWLQEASAKRPREANR